MESPLQILLPSELQISEIIFNELPEDCEYKIPFAKPRLISCNEAQILFQSFNGDDYWIELITFNIRSDISISLLSPRSNLGFILVLKGTLNNQGEQNNIIENLQQGSYAAFYMPASDQQLNLNKGEYSILYIIPPLSYLQSMAAEHKSIQELFYYLSSNNSNIILYDKFPFPKAVLRIIKSMERCHKKGAALDLVLRSYLLKFLSFYNLQLNEQELNIKFQTKEQVTLAVRDHILSNLANINLGRLKELTRQFPITQKTLTREFKKLFGKTVPQFIRDERLSLAHTLLTHHRKQVQEAALETGYDYLAHFSREFKKKYGYSPGSLKKIDRAST